MKSVLSTFFLNNAVVINGIFEKFTEAASKLQYGKAIMIT